MVEKIIKRGTESVRRLIRVSDERRANGLLRVGLDASRIIKGALKPAEYGIVTLESAWSDVVGSELAPLCAPDRIAAKTLYVRAPTGAAKVELLARAAEILPRIVLLLGEGVVEKIRAA